MGGVQKKLPASTRNDDFKIIFTLKIQPICFIKSYVETLKYSCIFENFAPALSTFKITIWTQNYEIYIENGKQIFKVIHVNINIFFNNVHQFPAKKKYKMPPDYSILRSVQNRISQSENFICWICIRISHPPLKFFPVDFFNLFVFLARCFF